MASSLRAHSFQAILKAVVQETREGGTATFSAGTSLAPTNLADGTAANQTDLFPQDIARTLTSGNNEDIDVFDWAQSNPGPGAGRDLIGNTLTLVEIVGVLIFNQTSSAGSITIGNNNTVAAWNSPFNASDTGAVGPIGPGGWFMIFDPSDPAFAVADTSNHLLRITATGGNVTYDIYMAGRSA